MLEFSVFQLTHLERPAPKDFERAMRQLEGLLKQPRGDQAKNLRRLGEDLRSDLLAALELRNRLAHDFLMEYRMTRAVDDNAMSWATEVLREAISTFDDLNGELDRHAETALADAGVPELSKEGRRKSLPVWSGGHKTWSGQNRPTRLVTRQRPPGLRIEAVSPRPERRRLVGGARISVPCHRCSRQER